MEGKDCVGFVEINGVVFIKDEKTKDEKTGTLLDYVKPEV